MSEPYARVPDVNQQVEFGITQGYKGPQAEHVRALSDSDHWVVPPSVRTKSSLSRTDGCLWVRTEASFRLSPRPRSTAAASRRSLVRRETGGVVPCAEGCCPRGTWTPWSWPAEIALTWLSRNPARRRIRRSGHDHDVSQTDCIKKPLLANVRVCPGWLWWCAVTA